MSKFNLESWCRRFLNKKCDDTKASELAGLVRSEAYKNGYTSDDVDRMYRRLNEERSK